VESLNRSAAEANTVPTWVAITDQLVRGGIFRELGGWRDSEAPLLKAVLIKISPACHPTRGFKKFIPQAKLGKADARQLEPIASRSFVGVWSQMVKNKPLTPITDQQ
jgi:hypothetical protein